MMMAGLKAAEMDSATVVMTVACLVRLTVGLMVWLTVAGLDAETAVMTDASMAASKVAWKGRGKV